jgi:hypothetical protein
VIVVRALNISAVVETVRFRRQLVRSILRYLAFFLITLSISFAPVHDLVAQANLIGTSANSGELVGYAITQNGTTVTVESVGQIVPTGRIGHLFGRFIGGREKDLVKVRKIRGDTFAFMTTSKRGSNIVRRVRLSKKVGALYYLLTGFDINSDGSDDVAIVDVSEHRYRWSIIENPMRSSARELQSFYLGFTGDRVEWSLSPSRDVEFAAIRQTINTSRTRALLRNSVTRDTRIFRSRWQQPSGLLIPLRLKDGFRYDPGIALYSPAKRAILMFDSEGSFVSYELPKQRCGGFQAVTNVDSQGAVSAIEVCGDGSYIVAQRAEGATGDEGDSIIASGALPEAISNLRRGDITVMRDQIGEVAVPIVAPGSDGSAVLEPVSPAPATGVAPTPTSRPQATPTSTPEDTATETPSPTPTATPIPTQDPNFTVYMGVWQASGSPRIARINFNSHTNAASFGSSISLTGFIQDSIRGFADRPDGSFITSDVWNLAKSAIINTSGAVTVGPNFTTGGSPANLSGVHGLCVLPDGSIIAGGYTGSSGHPTYQFSSSGTYLRHVYNTTINAITDCVGVSNTELFIIDYDANGDSDGDIVKLTLSGGVWTQVARWDQSASGIAAGSSIFSLVLASDGHLYAPAQNAYGSRNRKMIRCMNRDLSQCAPYGSNIFAAGPLLQGAVQIPGTTSLLLADETQIYRYELTTSTVQPILSLSGQGVYQVRHLRIR